MKKPLYRMISPVEILRSDLHVLGSIFDQTIIGNRRSDIEVKLRNQRIMEAYLTKKADEGWDLITTIDYDGLPYNGYLVFKKYVEIEEDQDASPIEADYIRNTNEGNLYSKFEEQTGKNAVWHGKETKAYLQWKQKIINGQE